jgi:hypothetical protein
VELEEFGPQADGALRLYGSFAILPPSGERPLMGRPFHLERAGAGGKDRRSTATGVEAMSGLLLDLAREIGEVVAALPGETKTP